MVTEWTSENFSHVTKKGVTLTNFWAAWCGPCRMQSPVIEQLEKEMDNVVFGKVNVDNNQTIAEEYGVMSIPTLVIQKDGQVVDTLTTYCDKEALKAKLEKYI